MKYDQQLEILATNLKNNINDFSVEEIKKAIGNIKPYVLPNPKSLTADEFNWMVQYLIYARLIVANLTKNEPNKI